MSDLIERQAAINAVGLTTWAGSRISRLHAIDAVPVVRCKDCIHNSLNRRSGNAFCEFGIGLFQLNDFCSRGERREDGVSVED